jgi:uncharacterized protein YdaL
MLILIIVLFYLIPTIISIIGDIYVSQCHIIFKNDLKEKLKNAKTIGDFLNCFQLNFFPGVNIIFMFVYLSMFLVDFLTWVFKFITKITKLDILWKKIINIKIRK